jgi:hypothetical protein
MDCGEKMNICVFAVVIVTAVLSSCTTGNGVSAMTTAPCNLATLKIKSVKIEGDRDEFVARAIKSQLYKRGATLDQSGVDVVGVVRWGTTAPLQVSVEVPTMAFASTASNSVPLGTAVTGSESLAKWVAADFCQCLAATAPEPDRTKK